MEILRKDDLVELEIEDIGAEGNGVGRYNGELVVFVPGTVPGDKVKAKIRKKKKKFAEASLFEIISPSSARVDPECEYFGTCNGCKMQNTNYQKQLEIKQNIVKNAFKKIGGFDDLDIPDVIGSEDIYFYRNKLEFSFSNDRWLDKADMGIENIDKSFALGYHIPGFYEKILDIRRCYLQSEISNRILNLTRDFFKSRNITIYSTKTHSGYLRFLTVRRSEATGEIMVNLITYDSRPELINEYAALLQKEIPEVSTLVNSLTQSKAQVALADNFDTVYGKGFITENISGYDFKITPNAFFQTNSKQCEKLFNIAASIAEFNGTENVLDLYCGCGAISLYISGKVNSVFGVELSRESIEMANENALLNNIKNCTFKDMDVKDFLDKLINDPPEQKYDVIILDPPRSGIHPKATEYLLQYEAPRIIYVSCNPATQARDLAMLKEKYEIKNIQPVDMFPHTFHIENVVRLELKPHPSLPEGEGM